MSVLMLCAFIFVPVRLLALLVLVILAAAELGNLSGIQASCSQECLCLFQLQTVDFGSAVCDATMLRT